MMQKCYCGISFEPLNAKQRFHNWRCGLRFHRLINAKELFRLTPEELDLRGKALNWRDRHKTA